MYMCMCEPPRPQGSTGNCGPTTKRPYIQQWKERPPLHLPTNARTVTDHSIATISPDASDAKAHQQHLPGQVAATTTTMKGSLASACVPRRLAHRPELTETTHQPPSSHAHHTRTLVGNRGISGVRRMTMSKGTSKRGGRTRRPTPTTDKLLTATSPATLQPYSASL